MCHKTICNQCKKWTWAGCGRHIEKVLSGIPILDRCLCNNVTK